MKYFLAILIIILLSGFLVWFGIYMPKSPYSEEAATFLVKKGDNIERIGVNLQSQGLIRHKYFFIGYILYKNKTKEMKAGQYELSSSMNIPDIVEKLVSNDRIKKLITIIEGWTIRDINNYLRDKGGTVPSELEGYLFPDTYEIFPEDGIEKIVAKMRANFEKKLTPELREEIVSQGKTIPEIVIMASMLEKEVKTFEDKKIVSGILWKRLESNMFLQVDATIIYLTNRKTTKILKEELKIDSFYNTYKYKGLPPAPICNPGLESILAAIEPQKSEYWFYLSTLEGETIFSQTLKEHNIAKEKYLR